MAHQAITVYISQEGGEIDDIQELLDGEVVELDWVGSLNGEDIPIKVRVSDEPTDTAAPFTYNGIEVRVIDDETADCEDQCAVHRPSCDGYCNHIQHVNQCLLFEDRRVPDSNKEN